MLLLPVVICALAAEPPRPLVEYPHPLITEVLYAVPTGEAGDVNGDGSRETNGDEFVELVNPHDRSINLRGYVLSGKASDDPKKKFKTLRFVFPDVTLEPGEVVVVFNGHGQKWTGPVGDTAGAPARGNDRFFGARVFTMNVDSARLGFSNKADYVLLAAPGGGLVECIVWGEIKAPDGVKLLEVAPDGAKGSVMRRTVDGGLEPHPPIDGKRYSPGKFPLDAPKPATDPAASPPPAPVPAPEPAKPQAPPKSKPTKKRGRTRQLHPAAKARRKQAKSRTFRTGGVVLPSQLAYESPAKKALMKQAMSRTLSTGGVVLPSQFA